MFRNWFRGFRKKPKITRRPAKPAETVTVSEIEAPSMDAVVISELGKRYYRWLVQSDGKFDHTVSQNAALDTGPTIKALRDREVLQKHLPRQPSILPKLVSIMKNPNSGADDLVNLINGDPAFVTKVLGLANSAFYRVTEDPIQDMHRALVYLGQEGLQRVVNAALIEPILNISTSRIASISQRIYQHAVVSAELAYKLANHMGLSPQMAHLSELLRATGDITLLSYTAKVFHDLDDGAWHWMLYNLCIEHSDLLAYNISRHWKLGGEIESVLGYLCGEDEQTTLSTCVQQALLAMRIQVLFDDNAMSVETSRQLVSDFNIPAPQKLFSFT